MSFNLKTLMGDRWQWIEQLLKPGWNFIIDPEIGMPNVADTISVVTGYLDFSSKDGCGGQGFNLNTTRVYLHKKDEETPTP